MKLSEADAPVSIESHYQVLRFVENSVIAELQKSDHAWLPVGARVSYSAVSYTHLRAHETVLDLVCRLLLEKKKHM